MISIENLMVDKVNTAVAPLKTAYPNLRVVSDYIETSETFPLISIVESDNYTHLPTQDAALEDHAVNVAFEINIFANDKTKKSTAKKIAAVVDAEMLNNLLKCSRDMPRQCRKRKPVIRRNRLCLQLHL